MYISGKKMAFLGLMLACSVLLVILGGIIETNTLFLLASASFCVGIAIRESGLRLGFGFYIASLILSFLLAPNKFYCITYAAMGFYLLAMELSWEMLAKTNKNKNRTFLFWIAKYSIFNIIYIPVILFLPKLIYQGSIADGLLVAFIAGGQIGLFIYDKAYNYFQRYIWGKVRSRFL